MTTQPSFRSVFLLIPLLIFSLLPLQAKAQFDPATGFTMCSRGEYFAFINDALLYSEPTAIIHKGWYGQCLDIHLERAKYLDEYLEKAITEYIFWKSYTQQTGDEAVLQNEDDQALDKLGHAFSDAVDRANTECIDKDDWKIMKRAIKWWGNAMEFGLAIEKYKLDEASFKERLCGKIHYNILKGEKRLGYYDYDLGYRVGVRLGKNEPRYDIPMKEEDPNVDGGKIVGDQTIDQQELENKRAEIEATIAGLEASGGNDEFTQGMIEFLRETLTSLDEAEASGFDKYRILTISPENNETGLIIKLSASMQDIPMVSDSFRQEVTQNPYRGSKWKFGIEAVLIRSSWNSGKTEYEEKGDAKHTASGEFTILWEYKDDGTASLGRTWANYVDKMVFNDYRFSNQFGGCKEYQSERFTLNGDPRFKLAWPVFYPGSPVDIVMRATLAPYIVVEPSDRDIIAMVYLTPQYEQKDYQFEYEVPCWEYKSNSDRRDYNDKREFNLFQLFQAGLPLEEVSETRKWDHKSQQWTINVSLNCVTDCPSLEDLKPPAPESEQPEEPEPEEEDDPCDPEAVKKQCEDDLRATILECSQYNDWQVSVDRPGAPGAETYCSDLGCVGANARSEANSPKDIFKTISRATDATCSEGAQTEVVQNVCSMTCVGYH